MLLRLPRPLLVLAFIPLLTFSATAAQFENPFKTIGNEFKKVGEDLKKPAEPAGNAAASNTADNNAAVGDIAGYKQALDAASSGVITARKAFLEAQSLLLQAVNPKNESALKLAEAQRAIEGASSDPKKQRAALKDSQKISQKANEVLVQNLAASQKLSAESSALYTKGAVKYIEAVVLEKQQIKIVRSLGERGKAIAGSASLKDRFQMVALTAPALELATMVPGDVKIGLETLPKLFAFAQSAGIEVPITEDQKAIIGQLD